MHLCRLNGQLKEAAGDDEIVLRIESGDAQVLGERFHNALLLAADMDPFALVERAVAAAAAMSGTSRSQGCGIERLLRQIAFTLQSFACQGLAL